jgi:YegS/Rv2252/BmrU family lipid kinase
MEYEYVFIINPISFNIKNSLNNFIDSVESFFLNHNLKYHIYVSKYPRSAISFIRNLHKIKKDDVILRIFAVGGDGILFDCVNGVIGLSDIELGAIPYGHSNDFLRAFGEGLNEQFRNIDNQVDGLPLTTDVIYCGNNYALNCCTIGMESYATLRAVELHSQFKSFSGYLPPKISSFTYNLLYFIGGVLSINNKTMINQFYQLDIDGVDYSGNYAVINVANGPCYGGDKNSAIDAVPNDGYLDVLIFKSTGIFNFINKGLEYLYGKYYKYPDLISYYRAKVITIRSKLPLVLQLDGEVFIDTNITIKIIENALKFVSVNDFKYRKFTKTA